MAKETIFTLVQGKEIPDRLNGVEIRYTLPTTLAEIQEIVGGDEAVLVSVFNEGYNLNHRQKIAKRFAAREGSTVESITEGMLKHKPGVAVERTPGAAKVKSERAKVLDDMLASLPADQQEAFKQRLAAIKPAKKVKAEDAPAAEAVASTDGTAPVASTEPKAKKAK